LHITFNLVNHKLASWCSVWHYGWSDFNRLPRLPVHYYRT